MHETIQRTPEITKATRRLRSTAGANSRAYRQGFAEGEAWASEDAEFDELLILNEAEVEQVIADANGVAIEAATRLAQTMGADDAQYFFGDDGEHNWRSHVPSKVTVNRLRGFVAGALTVLEACNEATPRRVGFDDYEEKTRGDRCAAAAMLAGKVRLLENSEATRRESDRLARKGFLQAP